MSDETKTQERTISRFVLIQLIHGAALEINSGLQMSRHGNCLKAARIQGLIGPKDRMTKKQLLHFAVAVMKDNEPDWEPASNVKKALEA